MSEAIGDPTASGEHAALGQHDGTDAAGEPTSGSPVTAPPASRYAMGSAANLFRSLAVILLLMLGLILLVPRVNSLSGPVVDIHQSALEAKQQSGWPIVEPLGLPAGWTPTAARYVRATDGKMTWLAGYQTPGGEYVSVEQTESASSAWISAQTNRATKVGEVEHDGVTWVQYERGAKVQNSLVHIPSGTDSESGSAPGELATLVTGTASFEDMVVFINHLVPVE